MNIWPYYCILINKTYRTNTGPYIGTTQGSYGNVYRDSCIMTLHDESTYMFHEYVRISYSSEPDCYIVKFMFEYNIQSADA